MQKLEKLYEGKAKMVFRTDDPELLIVEYKDDATAFNGEKRGTIAGKGVINNRVTNHLMTLLEKQGVPTHFVRELSDRETLVKKVTIVPLEVIVRNISAGSFAKRYGVEEGIVFDAPTIEFSYKNDSLGDPLINSYHALALKLATAEELEQIKALAFRVNDLLKGIMKGIGIDLVAACPMAASSSPTRSAPTPAASGTRRPTKNWTRIVSAVTSAMWRAHIRRSCAVCSARNGARAYVFKDS